MNFGTRLRDGIRLIHLSTRMVAGRRYWIWPLVTLIWPLFQLFRVVMEWREAFGPGDAQNALIGIPMTVLGLMLGIRSIAGEIDARTLEIAYTVPGGATRVWTAKLLGGLSLLLFSEFLLAAVSYVFATSFPIGALYGALQGAVVYAVLGMGLATLLKSESAGGLIALGVLAFNFLIQAGNGRISPFFNPTLMTDAEVPEVLAWTVQNRIGFALIVAAIIALAFSRSDQRERMLGT
ncbi:hypothetical protein ABI59_14285 [Acidobacteria bacterium Mor1]|nr:hypothetical protein ABI59_14285 [Acidobacteria bacterium Mor1]